MRNISKAVLAAMMVAALALPISGCGSSSSAGQDDPTVESPSVDGGASEANASNEAIVQSGKLEWAYPSDWNSPQQLSDETMVIKSKDGLVFSVGHAELNNVTENYDSDFITGIKALPDELKPDLRYVQKKSKENYHWYRCYGDVSNSYGSGRGYIEIIFGGADLYLVEAYCQDPSDSELRQMERVLDSKTDREAGLVLEHYCSSKTIDMSGYTTGTTTEEHTYSQIEDNGSGGTGSQGVTSSGANSVATYCYKMQGLYSKLAECMDDARDAEAAGDVSAAKEARKRSDDAYYEVLNSTAPAEAKDVDIKMRAAAASMNLLVEFYEDATVAKADGDISRYQEDLEEIITVIGEVDTDVAALGIALQQLTNSYQ